MNTYKTLTAEFNAHHLKFIEKLCKPLKDNFEIQFFEYRRFLPDGCSLGLLSDSVWSEYYCEHFLGQPLELLGEEIRQVSGGGETSFFRTGTPGKNDAYAQTLLHQGFWNGFVLYLPRVSHINGFYFIANVHSPSGLNAYVNRLDILKLFTTHFSHKIESIMESPAAQKLYVRTVENSKYQMKSSGKSVNTFHEMLQSLKIEEFQLPTSEGKRRVVLSSREFQCLLLMSKGQTFKEIGKSLDLSPRTVESYINNLKSKTETSSKSELIKLYFASPYRNCSL